MAEADTAPVRMTARLAALIVSLMVLNVCSLLAIYGLLVAWKTACGCQQSQRGNDVGRGKRSNLEKNQT